MTTTYYYITNLQGDVLSLVNASGTPVATYTYDPYGKPLTATGTLSNINPLRYRGYVYDQETGLYYLQSRYYDPSIGRFINADAFASTGQGIIGCNMFAYCGNNPILYSDETGTRYSAGEIHNFVVDHICANNPNKTRSHPKIKYKEVYFGHEYGFCDVYDTSTHEVWEVKRINSGQSCTFDAASKQLKNYVFNGILYANEDWKLELGGTNTVIDANCFTVRDKDGRGTYIIGYWDLSAYLPSAGIIYYDYIYIADPKEATAVIDSFLAIGIGIYLYKQIEAASNVFGSPLHA